MESTTTVAAQQYRLQQWAADIRKCQARPKDVSVDAWCRSQGITKANYYYRLQRVRQACLDGLQHDDKTTVFAPLNWTILCVEWFLSLLWE